MSHPPCFRLGLRHLMLYIAGVAMMLTLHRIIGKLTVELPRELYLVGTVYGYALAATEGVGVAAFLLWITQLEARSGFFPKQPGHWLLVADGLAALIGLGVQILTLELDAPQGKPYAHFYATLAFQIAIAPCYLAILTSALQTHTVPQRWQALFCLIVGVQLFAGLWSLAVFFQTGPYYVGDIFPWHATPYIWTLETIVLLVAVLQDRRAGEQRDWLHGVAIANWLLQWAMYLVWHVVQLQHGY